MKVTLPALYSNFGGRTVSLILAQRVPAAPKLTVSGFAWRRSLFLDVGHEILTDHVGPRWVSFAAKVQCV
jgi:hypothetical protein